MAESVDRAALSAAVTRVHIIGAGLAGLSAAVALAEAGRAVTIYDAGRVAGGRCRSYFDRGLGCRIDNGNHLLLSGNGAAIDYLARIGARGTLHGPREPVFPFFDTASGERWTLRLNRGRVPWWILSPRRRVPGTRARDYLGLLALRRAGAADTVADVLDRSGNLYRRLLEPLAVAALNTRPHEALASLLRAVVDETLLRGGAACLPLFPREGLSESLIDPAVRWLTARGGRLLTNHRIAGLGIFEGRIDELRSPNGTIPMSAGEVVVLAVPPWVATDMLPSLDAPDVFESILNIHFRVIADTGEAGFVGVIGGTAEWIFVKPEVVSVTVSAANHLVDLPADDIAARVWPEVRAALALPEPMPPVRVVKEKRATFAATATQERRRPGPRTYLANLAVAGDWTATGLPATIEGAIRSGRAAARVLLGAA
jgi:squalene-associated FAD-dependent desaturase